MAVRRVFCSYLNLLVNAKNDMALALTIDVPSRTLGRQAFTDIKHAAHNNNTSLFLVRNIHTRHVFRIVLKYLVSFSVVGFLGDSIGIMG